MPELITVWTRSGRYYHWTFADRYDSGGRALCGYRPSSGWEGRNSGPVAGLMQHQACRNAIELMKDRDKRG